MTLYRVLTRKTAADGTRWVALDGGMADNAAPRAVRRALHRRGGRRASTSGRATVSSLAGRHCESGDVLAHDVDLPPAGAGRPRRVRGDRRLHAVDGVDLQRHPAAAPPCCVDDGEARLLTRRETIAELFSRDL